MDELVELLQALRVGEDYAGDGLLVGRAVGTDDAAAEEGAYLIEEGGFLIVGPRNVVGYETGDAEVAEFLEDRGFAAPDASGEGYEERRTGKGGRVMVA